MSRLIGSSQADKLRLARRERQRRKPLRPLRPPRRHQCCASISKWRALHHATHEIFDFPGAISVGLTTPRVALRRAAKTFSSGTLGTVREVCFMAEFFGPRCLAALTTLFLTSLVSAVADETHIL